MPHARIEYLREQLGDAFVAVELADEYANLAALPEAALCAHRAPD